MAHGIFTTDIPDIDPVAATYLVWDARSWQHFRKVYNISSERIKIVKNEYLLNMHQVVSGFNRNKTLLNLGLSLEKPTILFLAPVWVSRYAFLSPYEANQLLKEFCEEISKQDDFQCIFRFHPCTSYYEDVVIKYGIVRNSLLNNCSIDQGMPLAEALNACDVVIGLESTVFVEALAAKKILLIYNTTGKSIARVYTETGAAIYIESRSQLLPALLSSFDKEIVATLNNNAKQFLHDHGFSGMDLDDTCALLTGTC